MISYLRRLFPEDLRSPLGALSADKASLIRRIRQRKLTYLSEAKLASLAESCVQIAAGNVPGLMVEAGCALGGSAILMATAKEREREFRIFDVFGVIPPPTENDTEDVHARYEVIASGMARGIGGDAYYGYRPDLYEVVRANLRDFGIDLEKENVQLVPGLIQETMKIDEPVALAHVDVDWYDPVMTSLERIVPRLPVGGIVILDDYNDWGGCRKAVDEYFSAASSNFRMDDGARSMKVTRISF
jgi:asparagine synthase (glutamine-hydrolysing)